MNNNSNKLTGVVRPVVHFSFLKQLFDVYTVEECGH